MRTASWPSSSKLGFGRRSTCGPKKIGAKIRDAQLEKLPAMLVVGQKEAEGGLVSYRDRLEGDKGAMALSAVVASLRAESDARTIRATAPVPTLAEPVSDDEKHMY